MENLFDILQSYNIIIIQNLFICVLFVKILSYFLNKEVYYISKQIISWLIIISGFTNILYWVYDAVVADEISFSNRATGPYAAVYWLMIFFACVLPFTLFFKKIRTKGWVLFIVTLLINTGWMFERFVIIITSLHRDYLPSSWSMTTPFTPFISSVIYGAAEAIIITAISFVVMTYCKTNRNDVLYTLLVYLLCIFSVNLCHSCQKNHINKHISINNERAFRQDQ